MGVKIIIVHGGGPQIEKELRKRKIIDKEYQGLRITTKEILTIVKQILGNQLNKMIVKEINKFRGNAISNDKFILNSIRILSPVIVQYSRKPSVNFCTQMNVPK